MTLVERLARKALPCRWPDAYADRCTCGPCGRRVDVEDAIREAIEACAATRCYPCDHFGAPTLLPGRRGLWHCTPSGEPVAHCDAYSIRRLLTDEETP